MNNAPDNSQYAIALLGLFWYLHPSGALSAPIPTDQLQSTATVRVYEDLGYINTVYNPRHFEGQNYAGQLTLGGQQGIAMYPEGSDEPVGVRLLDDLDTGEARMWSPMQGGSSTEYALLAGGSNETQFSRVDLPSLTNRVFSGPANIEPNSFDWVDNDTIVYTS